MKKEAIPPMLRRLGPLPCWRGEKRFMDAMARFYEKAMKESRTRLDRLEAER